MILFIFEGASYEPPLYDGIKTLFFPKSNDQVICSFCSSIYTFYKRLKDEFDGFGDVVDVLKAELSKTDPGNELFKYKSADFESIYLFFDYDFYRGNLALKNAQVQELLEYYAFCFSCGYNHSGTKKLISYCKESIRCKSKI